MTFFKRLAFVTAIVLGGTAPGLAVNDETPVKPNPSAASNPTPGSSVDASKPAPAKVLRRSKDERAKLKVLREQRQQQRAEKKAAREARQPRG